MAIFVDILTISFIMIHFKVGCIHRSFYIDSIAYFVTCHWDIVFARSEFIIDKFVVYMFYVIEFLIVMLQNIH